MNDKIPPLSDDWKMNYANLLDYHIKTVATLKTAINYERDQNDMLHSYIDQQKSNHNINKMINTTNKTNEKCTIL